MQTFRNTIQRRKIVSAVGLVLAIVVLVFALVYQAPKLSDRITSFMIGFQTGIMCVVIFSLGATLVQSIRAQKDETRMREWYIEENDERNQMIDQKAGSVGMNIVSYSITLATALAGSFNETVFFSLLGATILVVLVRSSLIFYYKRKFQ